MRHSTRNKIDAMFIVIELVSFLVNIFGKDRKNDK